MSRFFLLANFVLLSLAASAQVDYTSQAGQEQVPYVQPSETTIEGILERYGSFKWGCIEHDQRGMGCNEVF